MEVGKLGINYRAKFALRMKDVCRCSRERDILGRMRNEKKVWGDKPESRRPLCDPIFRDQTLSLSIYPFPAQNFIPREAPDRTARPTVTLQ